VSEKGNADDVVRSNTKKAGPCKYTEKMHTTHRIEWRIDIRDRLHAGRRLAGEARAQACLSCDYFRGPSDGIDPRMVNEILMWSGGGR
jgi:hypothetical protein